VAAWSAFGLAVNQPWEKRSMDSDASIIRAAIETEIDSYRYFVDSAGKAAHDRVRQVWLQLAGDEIEHMKILQTQLTSLLKTGEWEAEEGDEAALPEKAPIISKRAAAPKGEVVTDLEALEAGLKVEASTYQFYADAVAKTASAGGRKTYQQLARMEMGHYRLLEEAWEMLADPAQWQFRQSSPIQEG
jgi:rubrerythrin